MVFTKAIQNKWMTVHQIPVLNSEGQHGSRRAAFTEEEYDKIVETIEEMRDESRKEKTRQIRELLLSYCEFVINTGIRSGTEMEALTWGDIELTLKGHQAIFRVKIRKAKTTKHTGTRTVVSKDEISYSIMDLQERFSNRKPSDKLFRLADESETKELGPTFSEALVRCGLKNSPDGPRTLYSLRHSYITWQLLRRELRIDILARQCGTSTAMIEQHYSHVVPSMFEEELSGVKFEEVKTVKNKSHKVKREKRTKAMLEQRFKELEAEYKRRGCI